MDNQREVLTKPDWIIPKVQQFVDLTTATHSVAFMTWINRDWTRSGRQFGLELYSRHM